MEKIFENPFKAALKSGKPHLGLWVNSMSADVTEACACCGFDWLLLDGEHAPNSPRAMLEQARAAAPYPSHVLARVPEGSAANLKLVLDLGIKSVVVPMVDTPEQAEAMARAMSYPPEGVRGVGASVARAARWGAVPEYIEKARESLCLIVQAESGEALKNLDAITRTKGVDGVFIGPLDLATSLGFKGDVKRPEMQQVLEQSIRRIRELGKTAGVFALDPEMAKTCIAWGANMVAVACDMLALTQALRARLALFRQPDAYEF